jgi:two-component system OmpR family response regulator
MDAQQTSNTPAPGATRGIARRGEFTVLVVDDDPGMRTILMKILRSNGFHAIGAADHEEMTRRLTRHSVDLVLLDVMMPGRNGFDVCRDLRGGADAHLPVIMISARGSEADRVAGLELGADDYIAKPFGKSELLARVRAVLRRGRLTDEAVPLKRPDQLLFDGWTVDLRRRELRASSGAQVDLSGAEYDLLLALLETPQVVISRETLLEMYRARVAGSSDRSIDVLVCRLRQKLGDDEQHRLVRTVRGIGYLFAEQVERR